MRTTIEAMAAMLGGTQSLHTNALDEAIALPTDFSARIARNTQIVIQEETGMTKVVDPLGGTYYVEALTQELVDKARASIAASDVIVGVNKYRLKDEDLIEIARGRQPREVREAQIARINRVKAEPRRSDLSGGAEGAPRCGGGRTAIEQTCWSWPLNARGGGPRSGEISSAMEEAFGRHGTHPTPVKGVYGAPYEGDSALGAVAGRGEGGPNAALGRKPQLLVAKMGQDGHDRGANLVASAFGDLGFEVVSGPLFQTPDERPSSWRSTAAVDVVGASSLAAGHKTLIPELIGQLQAKPGAATSR
ncbi:Methylmalonyl-CoA mutase [Aphelenchoides bicaudatus]|nr:Methylmalonyl-CoA mutase [Aphelenchoides bicaudatus]